MASRRLQSEFFARMADPHGFRAIFEYLPDVYFFVKDRDGRMIAASSTILARLGLKRESDFIGTRDEEFFPEHVARGYVADDQQVFRTGKPLVDRLEVWFDEQRNLDWCLTTKVPIRGKDGSVIGLMGITRRDDGRSAHQAEGEVARVVRCMRENAGQVLKTAELARMVGMSERSLNRKINQAFGVSPYEMMLRIRVQKAAEALIQSNAEIAAIALDHGFCDQSTFTQHFRKRLGMTPREFRRRHRAEG